jgi:hypothetical protein
MFLLEFGVVVGRFYGRKGGRFLVSALEPQYLVGDYVFGSAGPFCVDSYSQAD